MADAAISSAMILTGKRKRTHVNYDKDEELDVMLEMDYGIGEDIDPVADSDDDISYGSRKKPKRKLAKKARFSSKPPARETGISFPFMSLPTELRNYIYELALHDDSGMTLVSKTKSYKRTVARRQIRNKLLFYGGGLRKASPADEPKRLIPNLLAVNKQIYYEAIGYLYMQPIIVEDTYTLHNFLATIGSHRSRVTHIIIRGYGCGKGTHKAMNFCAFTLLAACVNLRTIFLDCKIGWVRPPKNLAQQIYRDAHYFLNEFGLANGRRDAGVDILQLKECNFDRDDYPGWYRRMKKDQVPEREEFKREFQTELRKLLGC